MAEPSRSRRKAVDGLTKLPSTENEWRLMVTAHGIQHAKLQDLQSHGCFSASTVTKEAFLTMRCIWPDILDPQDALSYILNTKSFFMKTHTTQAERLINEGALELNKLDVLFDIICPERKTPRKWGCTVAEGLGPFSMLASLRNLILDKNLGTAPKDETPHLTFAPKKKGYYDASQPSSRKVQDSPLSRQSRPFRTEGSDAMDIDEDLSSEHSSLSDIEFSGTSPGTTDIEPEEIPQDMPNEIPDPRTPTETLIVDFMVNLLGGISCLLQPLAYHTACVANAYETTYRFGPIRNTSTASNDIGFRARVDGSIPFNQLKNKNLPEMVIFEAKRAERKGSKVPAVMGQQSMEHIAYIWKRHKDDKLPRDPGLYHTFMIAQDYLSLRISIGTYDNEYLDYIFGPGDAPIVSSRENPPFFRVQEFGPFNTDEDAHMIYLVEIIISLIACQLNRTEKGCLIQEALGFN